VEDSCGSGSTTPNRNFRAREALSYFAVNIFS
jgi:hypothetical protein